MGVAAARISLLRKNHLKKSRLLVGQNTKDSSITINMSTANSWLKDIRSSFIASFTQRSWFLLKQVQLKGTIILIKSF
jgi:hypothetical protein